MAQFILNNPHCLNQHRDRHYPSESLGRKAPRNGHESESQDIDAKIEIYGLKAR